MPGKHVHFSPSSSEGTPSPSYSTSTLPSSPGPITPPPLGFGSPYHTTPLPGVQAILHPCLNAYAGLVAYDLSQPLTTLTRTHPNLSPDFLDLAASQPPAPFMTVTCTKLPWTITVVPLSKVCAYVTIRDVFECLYRALRMSVTAAEYNQLPNAVAQNAVSRAFFERCQRRGPLKSEEEKNKGLRRVDFLVMQTNFCGFTPINKGLGGWILEVS